MGRALKKAGLGLGLGLGLGRRQRALALRMGRALKKVFDDNK
jgi:hypothetical protein